MVRYLGSVLLAMLLASCGLLPKKDQPPAATLPTWVGSIVMVDQPNRFVLVESSSGARPSPGQVFLSFGTVGRTASLRATEENRPPFAALEILEGAPAVGDRVALDESRPEAPPAPE